MGVDYIIPFFKQIWTSHYLRHPHIGVSWVSCKLSSIWALGHVVQGVTSWRLSEDLGNTWKPQRKTYWPILRRISQRSETPLKHITLATHNASDIFLTVYYFLSVFEIPCSEWLLYKHVCNMSAIASQTYKCDPTSAFKSKKLEVIWPQMPNEKLMMLRVRYRLYMALLFWNLCRSLKCLKSGGWHLSSEPRFEEEWCCLHKDIPIRIHPMFPPLLNKKWMPTLTSKSLPTQSLTGQAYFAECPSQQAKTRSCFAVALQAPCLYAAALPTCNQCINWPVKSQELLTNIGRHHVALGHGDSAPNEFGPTTPNGGSTFDKAVLYWYYMILYYTRPISSQTPMKPWDPALVSLHPHAVHGASGWSKPGT